MGLLDPFRTVSCSLRDTRRLVADVPFAARVPDFLFIVM